MAAGVDLPTLQALLNNDQGVLRCVGAAVVFVRIGVCAAYLAGRLRPAAAGPVRRADAGHAPAPGRR